MSGLIPSKDNSDNENILLQDRFSKEQARNDEIESIRAALIEGDKNGII